MVLSVREGKVDMGTGWPGYKLYVIVRTVAVMALCCVMEALDSFTPAALDSYSE